MRLVDDNLELRYLDAKQVKHPLGTLAGVEVCTADQQTLGCINGVLLEPARRRVRYFVIEREALLANRRYLVPTDDLATLNRGDGKIHVDLHADEADQMERFDARAVARFSDDDLISTIFAPPPAA